MNNTTYYKSITYLPMKRKSFFAKMSSFFGRGFVFVWSSLLVLLGGAMGTLDAVAQSSTIILKTDKNVGEKIKIRIYIQKDTPITIDGVEEAFENTWKEYTLTKQEVKITGVVKRLYCSNNLITAINTQDAPTLEELICSLNKIKSLDVSNNKKLRALTCIDNELEALTVKGAENLEYLDCGKNQLSSIDVTDNTKLNHLGLANNKLDKIDLQKNTKLTNLLCENNELTALNVAGLTDLIYINCFGNKIKGEAMTNFVNSLPGKTYEDAAELRVINSKGTRHDNHCKKSDALIAEYKMWTVQDYKGGTKEIYPGSDEEPPADDTEEISFLTGLDLNTNVLLEISGEGDITLEGLENLCIEKFNCKNKRKGNQIELFDFGNYLTGCNQGPLAGRAELYSE